MFMKEVYKTKECIRNEDKNLTFCKCDEVTDEGWPTFAFHMGDENHEAWFYLYGKDYLMKYDVAYKKVGYKCSILIGEDTGFLSTINWLLGDPFLRAYYSIYDFEKFKFGIFIVLVISPIFL